MTFVVLYKIDPEFADKMVQAIPSDIFDQALESGQRITTEILSSLGLQEDMARTIVSHIDYSLQFKNKGIFLEGGPFDDFKRAIVLVNSDSLNNIREIIENDPYSKEGVFVDFEIHRWHKVL